MLLSISWLIIFLLNVLGRRRDANEHSLKTELRLRGEFLRVQRILYFIVKLWLIKLIKPFTITN